MKHVLMLSYLLERGFIVLAFLAFGTVDPFSAGLFIGLILMGMALVIEIIRENFLKGLRCKADMDRPE
jgi:hypothetical protein